MPYDGRITSAVVGIAMALSPFSMAMAKHHDGGHGARHGEGHRDEPRDGPGSSACHAACLRDDRLPKRPTAR